jgi:hypothetical protein
MAPVLGIVVGCAGASRAPEAGAIETRAEQPSAIDPKTCTGRTYGFKESYPELP